MSNEEARLGETGPFGESRRSEGDRREHPRVAMLSNVTLRIPTSADRSPVEDDETAELVRDGRSGDVSLGGMFVESTEPITPGTKVEASFAFPDCDVQMAVPAEVRWSRGPGRNTDQSPWKFGIRFLDLSDEQQSALRAFVANRKSN